jgi:hypothetical protein
MKVTNDDFNGTVFEKALRPLGRTPCQVVGSHGHSVREVAGAWRQAVEDERDGAPMPSGRAAHEWDLRRELRLVAKQLFVELHRAENGINDLTRRRDDLRVLINESAEPSLVDRALGRG